MLEQYNVELIGASVEAINTAENRHEFKAAMEQIGLAVPRSGFAYEIEEAVAIAEQVGFPLIVRPSFILGGGGTGMANDAEEFRRVAEHGLATSPVSEILIEQSVAGWKEYELEVMRDHADNVVVVCSIENFDAMGVHTGDSITVAPAQTLTDVEYQRMRDAAFACIRRIGVDTGGSNIQFGLNPENGDMVVIEMNPRVSRSSALASKATGFPIAKIAARLAVGYRLDEIMNDITGETPASFEPTIDYVVTKVPRWAFEKLPGVVGRARHDDAVGRRGDGDRPHVPRVVPEGAALARDRALRAQLRSHRARVRRALRRRAGAHGRRRPRPSARSCSRQRCDAACRSSASTSATGIDPWFLDQMLAIVEERATLARRVAVDDDAPRLATGQAPRLLRRAAVVPVERSRGTTSSRRGAPPECEVTYKTVDTCAAEFAARTPYHYGTYEDEDEVAPLDQARGRDPRQRPEPHRPGRRVRLLLRARRVRASDAGYETVMVNCNPETVSTDYDTSDRLFFEPLTREDVLAICRRLQERGELAGVVVRARWPDAAEARPRARSARASRWSAPSPDSIDLAEDRERFHALCERARDRAAAGRHRLRPPRRRGRSPTGSASRCWCDRPTCWAAAPCRSSTTSSRSTRPWPSSRREGTLGREGGLSAERPVLVDRFLEDAVEVDVDALRDAHRRGRHRRRHGAHRGGGRALGRLRVRDPAADAARRRSWRRSNAHTRALADALDVRGLLNVQYAVKDGEVFVIEANPRASAHGAVREQGDGRAARQGRGAGDARRDARRAARRRPAATARGRRAHRR